MGDARQRNRLALETSALVDASQRILAQALDRDVASQVVVVRPVDTTCGAGANYLVEPVAAIQRCRHRGEITFPAR